VRETFKILIETYALAKKMSLILLNKKIGEIDTQTNFPHPPQYLKKKVPPMLIPQKLLPPPSRISPC
jgi:hypothetical protein